MNLNTCPDCGDALEDGFVNAPLLGILWSQEKDIGWTPIASRKYEKLQKDWWGPKLSKENIPAVRCQKCRFVAFQCKQ